MMKDKTKPLNNNFGWECPKCGAVMSPYTIECIHCRPLGYPSRGTDKWEKRYSSSSITTEEE